jgi:hypothetical protein
MFEDSKQQSDFLAPLKRWLAKQVGRPWNKVYSELKSAFPARKHVYDHIFTHVFGYVVRARDIVMIDKKPYWKRSRYGAKRPEPITERGGDLTLYVRPDNGLLYRAPRFDLQRHYVY